MEGDDEPFDYVLAENLHMTVDQMRSIITNDEWLRWKAFYVYRAAQLEPKT